MTRLMPSDSVPQISRTSSPQFIDLITRTSKLFNSFSAFHLRRTRHLVAVGSRIRIASHSAIILRSKPSMAPVAKLPFQRWIKPEVYPLFLALGTALSAGGFTIVRNLTRNPDVRISKEDREAGMLDNSKEGEAYKNHSLRKFLEGKTP